MALRTRLDDFQTNRNSAHPKQTPTALNRTRTDTGRTVIAPCHCEFHNARPALDENCHREKRQRRGDLAPAQVAIFLLGAKRRGNPDKEQKQAA